MLPVPLQLGTSFIGVLFLLFILAAIRSSVVIVEAYEREAYTRIGEYQKLLEPGFNVV